MAVYMYQARTARGERITGSLDAETEYAVDDALREGGPDGDRTATRPSNTSR